MSNAPEIVTPDLSGEHAETGKIQHEAGRRVAMRVILPNDGDLDAIPLYVDPPAKGSADTRPNDLRTRRSMVVRPGKRASLGSYFNAFPAGYWKTWTVAEDVRLTVRTSGEGSIFIYKSNARGASQQVTHTEVSGEETSVFDLSLAPFGDGGFYWFDLIGGEENLILEEADWSVADAGRPRSSVTIGVTTFNRADYCVRTIGMVAADPELREILDELVIIDQGTQKVREESGYDDLAAEMGGQLRIIEQPNLGGSGGFSRCMYEAATGGRSDHVILLDDDIILETESINRLATFADLCRKQTIVGGHMFDMNNRDTLHTFGEIVDPFWWQPGLPGGDQQLGHKFGKKGLRSTPWMHQRIDVDYNGWWMCLIPVNVVRQLGLSLPIFIKWDDSEYGLRAKEAGIPTVSLPGAAVWHVSWTDKDDLVGWQAYFHARNRLITAIMYSPFDRGASMLRTAYFNDLKHLVAMQYYTGTGRVKALEDALAGPEHLHSILPKRLGEIRAMAGDFSDSRITNDLDSLPEVRRRKPIKPPKPLAAGRERPPVAAMVVKGMSSVIRQMVMPVDQSAMEHPQARVPHKDNKWYNVARNDSAIVSNAEGTGVSWYKRDRDKARALAAKSTVLHAQVVREWGDLRERYRAAREEITSFEAWEKTFGLTGKSDSE